MSFHIRAEKIWPCNVFAQYIWHFLSILEDINELLRAQGAAIEHRGQVTLLRFAIVGLHSFDELAKEFHNGIRTRTIDELSAGDQKRLLGALSQYHRTVEPFRADLAAVRHTLGAHRGLSSSKEQKRFRKDFKAWGEWESTLAALETRCERAHWQMTFEAAFDLYNTVITVNAARWYWAEGDRFRLYTPIRFPGDDTVVIPQTDRSA